MSSVECNYSVLHREERIQECGKLAAESSEDSSKEYRCMWSPLHIQGGLKSKPLLNYQKIISNRIKAG